jgi:hypothetical protein
MIGQHPKRLFFILCMSIQQCIAQMIGKCEQCGMTDVEVKTIRIGKNGKTRTLCNQCRPADGAYAY